MARHLNVVAPLGTDAASWAALLRRVFATDPWPWSLANPANCGRRMKLRAELVLSSATPARATHRILAGLAAASGTPP